jgi:hypothetical protein
MIPDNSSLILEAVAASITDAGSRELSSEVVDHFRMVGDVALSIQSHEMTPRDHAADKFSLAASSPVIGFRNTWRRDEWTGRNPSSGIGRP